MTARTALSIGGLFHCSDEESGSWRRGSRMAIATLLARRTTVSGRHAPGHDHYGRYSRNGVFRLGLILGGSWRLRRQTGVTIELKAARRDGSAVVAILHRRRRRLLPGSHRPQQVGHEQQRRSPHRQRPVDHQLDNIHACPRCLVACETSLRFVGVESKTVCASQPTRATTVSRHPPRNGIG